MIHELRIKCPSCGLILDVRNSKHEAVKTITCPGCKKQLAIDFQEKPAPKPIPPLYYGEMSITLHEGLNPVPIPDCAHLEINVVRISDGGCKCIVHSLSADFPVTVNGTKLELGDRALLDVGDQLRIGNTTLVYGKAIKKEDAPISKGRLLGDDSYPKKKRHINKWLVGILSMLIATIAIFLIYQYWPKKDIAQPVAVVDRQGDSLEVVDTPTIEQDVPQTPATREVTPPTPTTRVVTPPAQVTTVETKPSYSNMSDYDLELQVRNDVAAQYELGKRLVARGDSSQIVLGINYLKMAMHNGSSDARQALQNTFNRLEQKAANGNRVAENILREQR